MKYFVSVIIGFLVLVIFVFASSVYVGRVKAQTLVIDAYGNMYLADDGQVLGEDNKSEVPGSQAEPEPEEDAVSMTASTAEPSTVNRQVEPKELRVKTSIRRIEVKNGKLRIRTELLKDKEHERLKFEQKLKEQARQKLEQTKRQTEPTETEIESEDEEEATPAAAASLKVHEGIERNAFEIKAVGNAVEIEQRRARVRTHFPLSIGSNNELIVTTPNGEKEVTVLPDAAVAKMLEHGVLTRTETETEVAATQSTGQERAKQNIELSFENGILQYKVKGIKEAKLFGIIPVVSPVEANVSAQTGAVTGINQPWYFNYIGFLFTR